jgi:hypothetical protein
MNLKYSQIAHQIAQEADIVPSVAFSIIEENKAYLRGALKSILFSFSGLFGTVSTQAQCTESR